MKKLIILLIPLLFLVGCTDSVNEEQGSLDKTTKTNISSVTVDTTTTTTSTVPTTNTTVSTTISTTKSTTKVAIVKTSKETTKVVNKQGRKVYKTPTGKKYHYDNHCNGGTYIETTMDDAISLGLGPCKKCVLN